MTQQAQDALKPCPFCGSEVALKPSRYGDYQSVICMGNNPCEGQMSIVIPNDGPSSGIAAWNRRTPARLEAQQEVLLQGWKLVPVASTEAIEQAAADYLDAFVKASGLWSAMLAAAPTPPAQERKS